MEMALELVGEAAQLAFGETLAACLPRQAVLYLEGDLGTGKTTLARGILRGLGHRGSARSPTFTLLEPYALGDRRLYHLDLYRLTDPEELEYLGLRDLLAEEALWLIEWPERGQGALPPADLLVRLDFGDTSRQLRLLARSAQGADVVARAARRTSSACS